MLCFTNFVHVPVSHADPIIDFGNMVLSVFETHSFDL